MHNLDNKHPTRPGFEPSNPRVLNHSRIEWAIGTASLFQTQNKLIRVHINGASNIINMINRAWDLP